MKLISDCVNVSDLTADIRDEMFALFARHYDRAVRECFEADLDKKQWVIRLRAAATGELRGFSTQVLLNVPTKDRPICAVFSGDTIIDRSCWGEAALMREWGRLVMELVQATPQPLYWFLISKGYKTYRFLPVFFREFYPRYDRETPPWAADILEALGRSAFGTSFDPSRGIVKAALTKDRLRRGIADVTPKRLQDPHVRFFVERNPHHAEGDELCCLAPIDVANFTPAGIRLLDPKHLPARSRLQRNSLDPS